ncbi:MULTISPECIES: hypothetical protein [unclassified Sphingomonas]|uniref:hypothetical protein n=1 Tax=Sphingomonas TaxID=13687 RepID=UPI00095BC10A|nr:MULTISPECIES: hypothetical protein [unclassified Sphingomonas]MBN8809819.1 hypothetical protein [Sphingomonas sp.]OJY50438.1 MAG: hypothetical protein BGP17_18475 [Sphingomonas sp. 67-41]
MTQAAPRPLEDLIGELLDGIAALPTVGVRATGITFDLPIEARVDTGPAGPLVRADLPRTRTRTWFDRPVGRLSLRIGTLPVEEAR